MFKEYFKVKSDVFTLNAISESQDTDINKLLDKIRKDNIRVKTIIPTKFGTEIVFYNATDAENAAGIINTKEVDDKSIFVPKG